MTGTEILAMANLHTEADIIDPATALKYINEWLLMDLGRDAGIVDSETIVAKADEWKALSNDFIEETEITRDGKPYRGKFYGQDCRGEYDIRNGQIRFPYAGTYVIYYIRRPAPLASITGSPEVNAVFHYSASIYVAMRYKYYDDEDSKDAVRLRKEYDYYRDKAVLDFKKMSKSTTRAASRVKVRAW